MWGDEGGGGRRAHKDSHYTIIITVTHYPKTKGEDTIPQTQQTVQIGTRHKAGTACLANLQPGDVGDISPLSGHVLVFPMRIEGGESPHTIMSF